MDIKEISNILDASLDGMYITDKNGVILFYNKSCEYIEGISKDIIIGSNMSDLVENGLYSSSVALEVIKTKKTIKLIQEVNNKQVLAHGTPIFKDGILSTVRRKLNKHNIKIEF